jgi:hypothetical protein
MNIPAVGGMKLKSGVVWELSFFAKTTNPSPPGTEPLLAGTTLKFAAIESH